jgi:hypothetical protein
MLLITEYLLDWMTPPSPDQAMPAISLQINTGGFRHLPISDEAE